MDLSGQPVSLPIESITRANYQPRRYFDPTGLQQLTASIKANGILQSLLVRPIADGQYELVAGERRYLAAQAAGLTNVPVIVQKMSDMEARQLALVENLQRENLSPLDETEGVLQLLSLKLDTNQDGVVSILNQIANKKRGITDNVVRAEQQQIITEVFDTIGKMSAESFRTHRLPLLKLPDDLLEALRTGQIEYTKAKALAKITDVSKRSEILELAIKENWSLKQIKTYINSLTPQKSPTVLVERWEKTYKQVTTSLKNKEIWQDNETRERLEELLTELDNFLTNLPI
jgi:ParB family transcriptional regulator, chromosome partitioning protein